MVAIPEGVEEDAPFVITHKGREYTIHRPKGVACGQDIEVEL